MMERTIVGAGKTDGAMDAGNMLKPMLARGELHCIGATTLDEYRQYIEKDAALERRFQPVLVDEPTVEDAISILRGLKEKGMKFSMELRSQIVRLLRWQLHYPTVIFPTVSCRIRPSILWMKRVH